MCRLFCLAALVVAGLLSPAWLATAADGRSKAGPSAVQAASYSTGESGGRLKWLPQRPDSAGGDAAVVATAHAQSAAAPRPLRTAQNRQPASSPFIDPFGDKRPAQTPAPAEELGEELLPQMPAEPAPRESLPALDADEPAPLTEPYVPPGGMAPLKPAEPDDSKHPPLGQELEQEMAARQHAFREECPSPKDLKPIGDLSTNIAPSEGELPHDCPLGNATFQPRVFAPITYTWTASALCHKPLYFDDVQLERYGHMCGPWVQPFLSGGRFFINVLLLPYEMGVEPPNECLYTLGYYRPGNCAPYVLDPFPLSVRGAFFEAGAWVGGVYAFP